MFFKKQKKKEIVYEYFILYRLKSNPAYLDGNSPEYFYHNDIITLDHPIRKNKISQLELEYLDRFGALFVECTVCNISKVN